MSYILAPLNKIKGEGQFPEYQSVLKSIQDAAIKRAENVWTGYTLGGLTPGQNKFGIGPMRKNDMAGDTTDSTKSGSYTFRKTITATGWQDLFNYKVRKDMLQGFAGFAFTDDVLRVTQIRLQIADRSYPIFDLQEAQGWSKFGIILKEDQGDELIAEPSVSVLVRIYAESTGVQRIVPLGFQLFKFSSLVLAEAS